MVWREEILVALKALGGTAHLNDIEKYIKKYSTKDFKNNNNIASTIRAELQFASSEARHFKGRYDLFYSSGGFGSGKWGLRTYFESTIKAIDLGVVRDEYAPEKVKTEIFRVLRDTVLSRKIKFNYDYKCQICGKSIKLKNGKYIEAHHIQPLGGHHEGPDIESNIIILCPNHHTEFDYGVIAINPESLTVIHMDKNNHFNDKELMFKYHKLDEKYLKYHLNKIYNSEIS